MLGEGAGIVLVTKSWTLGMLANLGMLFLRCLQAERAKYIYYVFILTCRFAYFLSLFIYDHQCLRLAKHGFLLMSPALTCVNGPCLLLSHIKERGALISQELQWMEFLSHPIVFA